MNDGPRDLVQRIEDWPEVAQQEELSALEAIAGQIYLHEPSPDDR